MNQPNTSVNIIIAGLGGQGVLKASDIVAEAAFRTGYDVKKAEVHGVLAIRRRHKRPAGALLAIRNCQRFDIQIEHSAVTRIRTTVDAHLAGRKPDKSIVAPESLIRRRNRKPLRSSNRSRPIGPRGSGCGLAP